MKSAFRITILLSLLLHVLVFTPWLLTDAPSQPLPIKEKSIEFTLQPPVEDTLPPEDLPPPARHLEDDITKANTSDGLAETQATSAQPPQQGNKSQPDEASAGASEDTVAKIPKTLQPKSNSPMLSDFLKQQALNKKGMNLEAQSTVASPLEQLEEEKARWYNEVLKRIREQVNYVWVKPQGLSRSVWGVIRLDIDRNGYLVDAWVHLPSGNARLDRSALRAIHQVLRYEIPQSEKLSRYYRHLEFRYHGGEQDS